MNCSRAQRGTAARRLTIKQGRCGAGTPRSSSEQVAQATAWSGASVHARRPAGRPPDQAPGCATPVHTLTLPVAATHQAAELAQAGRGVDVVHVGVGRVRAADMVHLRARLRSCKTRRALKWHARQCHDPTSHMPSHVACPQAASPVRELLALQRDERGALHCAPCSIRMICNRTDVPSLYPVATRAPTCRPSRRRRRRGSRARTGRPGR